MEAMLRLYQCDALVTLVEDNFHKVVGVVTVNALLERMEEAN